MAYPTYVVWVIAYTGLNPENRYLASTFTTRTRFEAVESPGCAFHRVCKALKAEYPEMEWVFKGVPDGKTTVPNKKITEVSMIMKDDPGIYVIARRMELDEYDIPFVSKHGTQIGFTYDGWKPTPWSPYDETEFDTVDEEEAKALFQEFCKENKFENVEIRYIQHRQIEDEED